MPTAEVQADRLRSARALAERFGCVVLLKGSGSVIAAPGRVPHINPTGNAALATAGTGDVLAGWIGGLWAQDGGAESALRDRRGGRPRAWRGGRRGRRHAAARGDSGGTDAEADDAGPAQLIAADPGACAPAA